MNAEIETIFAAFQPAGSTKPIPVDFLHHDPETPGETYMTYNALLELPGLVADNTLQATTQSYDFHIFSKSNYANIESAVKALLGGNGWVFIQASEDLYEEDTRYFHKIITFEKERNY